MNSGYVCIDLATCDGCFACGAVCEPGAITAGKALRPAPRKAAKVRSDETAVVAKVATPAVAMAAVEPKNDNAPTGTTGWTLIDAGAVASVLLAALLAKDAVVGHPAFGLIPAQWKTAAFMIVLALFYAAQVSVLTFLARRHARALSDAFRAPFRDLKASALSFVLVAGLLVLTRMASTGWGVVLKAVGWDPPGEGGVLNEIFGTGTGGVFLVVLMAVIVGPVVEELVFRGVIASAIRSRFGLTSGVLLSAMLFSLYHVTPWLYVQMFLLGCALGWLALTRRTLLPAVMLHALYNAVSVAVWLLS